MKKFIVNSLSAILTISAIVFIVSFVYAFIYFSPELLDGFIKITVELWAVHPILCLGIDSIICMMLSIMFLRLIRKLQKSCYKRRNPKKKLTLRSKCYILLYMRDNLVAFRIDSKLLKEIRIEAERNRRSFSDMVRLLLSDALQEKKIKKKS